MNLDQKTCTTCRQSLPRLDNFYKQTSSRDGLQYTCKKCHATSKNEYRRLQRLAGIKQPHRAPRKSTLELGDSLRNLVIAKYRSGAKQRNLDFELTNEQLLEIFAANCFYCEAPPSNRQSRRQGSDFVYSGIDRYNNKEGYTVTNSIPCCRICNFSKSNTEPKEFLAWVQRIATHTSLWADDFKPIFFNKVMVHSGNC